MTNSPTRGSGLGTPLPDDLWIGIADFLDGKTLWRLSTACKRLAALIESHDAWHDRLAKGQGIKYENILHAFGQQHSASAARRLFSENSSFLANVGRGSCAQYFFPRLLRVPQPRHNIPRPERLFDEGHFGFMAMSVDGKTLVWENGVYVQAVHFTHPNPRAELLWSRKLTGCVSEQHPQPEADLDWRAPFASIVVTPLHVWLWSVNTLGFVVPILDLKNGHILKQCAVPVVAEEQVDVTMAALDYSARNHQVG